MAIAEFAVAVVDTRKKNQASRIAYPAACLTFLRTWFLPRRLASPTKIIQQTCRRVAGAGYRGGGRSRRVTAQPRTWFALRFRH